MHIDKIFDQLYKINTNCNANTNMINSTMNVSKTSDDSLSNINLTIN